MNIAERLEVLFPKTSTLQKKYRVKEIFNDMQIKTKIFMILNISGIFIYNITPLASQLKGIVFEGREFQRTLPTQMWYAFDAYQPVVYEILYFTISWTGFTLATIILSTDLLFCAIISLLSMQFRILAQNILEISHEKPKEALKELKQLIEIHQELIDLSLELEKIFSPSFLLNVMSSGFVICLTGFQTFVS